MSRPLGLRGPHDNHTPHGYFGGRPFYGHPSPTYTRGWGDTGQAARQAEADGLAYASLAWAGVDESEIGPVRGWDLAKLGRGPSAFYQRGQAERQKNHQVGGHEEPPLFALVRAEGAHQLYQVMATTTGARVTSPRPLPAAKLALATMRSAFDRMGRV